MTRRLVWLTAGLWAALYGSQRLARMAFDVAHVSIVHYAWVFWLLTVLCAAGAAWLIGTWRGATGRRLLLTSLVSCAASFVAWLATDVAVMALASVGALANPGETASVVIALLFAAEVVAVSSLVSRVLPGSLTR
jgi:hypothetical protein